MPQLRKSIGSVSDPHDNIPLGAFHQCAMEGEVTGIGLDRLCLFDIVHSGAYAFSF
ncbi:protein of unknown function [Nitrospira japonica]|uniref:Uncharacterized protein n=1 Tax=Nitrospira japonica TaxID=1325564 RepID=A0A1W1I215_9BACT|nr:protein of unknown function [Nitrospira japonica]